MVAPVVCERRPLSRGGKTPGWRFIMFAALVRLFCTFSGSFSHRGARSLICRSNSNLLLFSIPLSSFPTPLCIIRNFRLRPFFCTTMRRLSGCIGIFPTVENKPFKFFPAIRKRHCFPGEGKAVRLTAGVQGRQGRFMKATVSSSA